MKVLLSLLSVFYAAGALLAGETAVTLTKNSDTVTVTIGGEEFAVYNFNGGLPKPFFSPVRGPGGSRLTRPLENPEDHPHHKGIWLAIDEVNGIEFWAERGEIENVSVDVLDGEGNPARMKVVNRWLAGDGRPIVGETTVISMYANRLIAYDITFTAGRHHVTFGDTKGAMCWCHSVACS